MASSVSLTSLELAPCFTCFEVSGRLAEWYLECSRPGCAGNNGRTPLCGMCMSQVCPHCNSQVLRQDLTSVSNRLSIPTSAHSWDPNYVVLVPEDAKESTQHNVGSYASEPEHIQKTIIVPSNASGRIIGTKGKTIKEMRTVPGIVRVDLGQESEQPDFRGTVRELMIVGTADAVAEISRKIEAIVNRCGHPRTKPETLFYIDAANVEKVQLIEANLDISPADFDVYGGGRQYRTIVAAELPDTLGQEQPMSSTNRVCGRVLQSLQRVSQVPPHAAIISVEVCVGVLLFHNVALDKCQPHSIDDFERLRPFGRDRDFHTQFSPQLKEATVEHIRCVMTLEGFQHVELYEEENFIVILRQADGGDPTKYQVKRSNEGDMCISQTCGSVASEGGFLGRHLRADICMVGRISPALGMRITVQSRDSTLKEDKKNNIFDAIKSLNCELGTKGDFSLDAIRKRRDEVFSNGHLLVILGKVSQRALDHGCDHTMDDVKSGTSLSSELLIRYPELDRAIVEDGSGSAKVAGLFRDFLDHAQRFVQAINRAKGLSVAAADHG